MYRSFYWSMCRFFCGLLLLGAMSVGAAAQTSEDKVVVAKIDGREVTRRDLLDLVKNLPDTLPQPVDKQTYKQVLEYAVQHFALVFRAKDAGFEDNDAVKQRIEFFSKMAMVEGYVRDLARQQLHEDDIKQAYALYKSENPPQKEVHARHILLDDEQKAKDIIAEIDGGLDFAELARKHSTGPSGPKGGDLGFFGEGRMVSEFSEVAFALNVGEHSASPVKTRFGWHVIKVEEIRELPPESFEAIKVQIENQLIGQKMDEIMRQMADKLQVELFDLQGKPLQ